MSTSEHEAAFQHLRAILEPYADHLVKVQDEPASYYLDSPHLQSNKKPLFFGSARIGRQHVSFHLMPVYLWPEMLAGISDALRRRMQGKSCFNLKTPDEELLRELNELTQRGFERYREHGYVR